ncbi:MAG: hypothetical protein Q9196_001436 [Gyalolechia fulgens]
MDPTTSTREQFTNGLISSPVPDNAAPDWKKYVERLKVLLQKLAHHPAMVPNLQQTFMTPANSKNKVYFQWDFVGRTLDLSKEEKEAWQDAVGRASFAKMLILDTQPGMLDMMTERAYPAQGGKHPEFGEEILELARHLDD